ncbi:MAG: molecular chaperone GrpE [Pseudonocardiales bacterium]|nr:molecular chaperone GrpE [Pseudonocardiales bacterium]
MTAPFQGQDEPDRVIIRDKRRIDPVTGAVREPAPDHADSAPVAPPAPSPESAEVTALQAAIAERTADLQRVQAEYANYRKRAERDRLAAGEVAVSRVLAGLLPVLDDIDRARQHGDLSGAFKAVADQLDAIFDKLGLESFGAEGDPFDPSIHEAVLHAESEDVSEPTCTTVMRPGYKHGERLLRAAMVGVTDPVHPIPRDAMTATASEVDPAPRDATPTPDEDDASPGDPEPTAE